MSMTDEMKKLMELFEEWIHFCGTLQELAEETWNTSLESGKWTVKDIVCHIMLWDRYFYKEAIEKIALGERITLKHLNFDDFNRKAMIHASTIGTDELIDKAVYYRKKILAAIEAMPEASVAQNYIDGDGNTFHIPQYLKDFIWHDQHHMNPLMAYIKGIKN